MSEFNRLDWIALFAITITTYFQFQIGEKGYKEYNRHIRPELKKSGWPKILCIFPVAPPGWIFGPVWFVLYALISAGVFIFWLKGNPDGDQFISFMTLYDP